LRGRLASECSEIDADEIGGLTGSIDPICACSPSTVAPPSVAMRNASPAPRPECSAALRASASTSSAPEAAGLSVPSRCGYRERHDR